MTTITKKLKTDDTRLAVIRDTLALTTAQHLMARWLAGEQVEVFRSQRNLSYAGIAHLLGYSARGDVTKIAWQLRRFHDMYLGISTPSADRAARIATVKALGETGVMYCTVQHLCRVSVPPKVTQKGIRNILSGKIKVLRDAQTFVRNEGVSTITDNVRTLTHYMTAADKFCAVNNALTAQFTAFEEVTAAEATMVDYILDVQLKAVQKCTRALRNAVKSRMTERDWSAARAQVTRGKPGRIMKALQTRNLSRVARPINF